MKVVFVLAIFGLAFSQSITDFWDLKHTKWEFISESNFGSSMNVGTFFVPVGDIWYLFYREYGTIPQPQACVDAHRDIAKIVLTWSTDKGKTWNPRIDVALPNPNNSYANCAVVDGGAFYDEENSTWHYLGQCLGDRTSWALCHYFRNDKDPRGNWTENPANPVVKGGQLFKKICKNFLFWKKLCSTHTTDEGTPDIVEKIDDEFYFTFHGYDYHKKKAVRAVAATKDFVQFRTSGKNLPGDALFTYKDCQKWNVAWKDNKCVGGGEGTTIVGADGYKYMIIEAPDISLGCLTEVGVQNWVLGLVRSKGWEKSDKWEEFSINPVVIPWEKKGCAIQYHRLFIDKSDNRLYLSYWIFDGNTGGMKIFRLTEGTGDLPLVANPYTASE